MVGSCNGLEEGIDVEVQCHGAHEDEGSSGLGHYSLALAASVNYCP